MLTMLLLSSIEYFSDPQIDYFKEADVPVVPNISVTAPISKNSGTAFDWKKYKDPKNPEFFKEGDYTPPAPFMEIARNPSDENIKNWFEYLETKNAIHRRLQMRLTEYDAKNKGLNSVQAPPPLIEAGKSNRLRMFFDSKCPHCKRMMGELKRLSLQGFTVDLRQVDGDLAIRRELEFPVRQADKNDLSRFKIETVPTLLVANEKLGTFFKLTGFQTAEEVLSAIGAHQNQKESSQ